MTECRGALSAYVPVKASAQTVDFEYPLKIYIIETVERETRFRRLRQLGVALTVLVGHLRQPVAGCLQLGQRCAESARQRACGGRRVPR